MTGLSERSCDTETGRAWAAEHLAVELGLLRECPYHGEPVRVRGAHVDSLHALDLATCDLLLAVFGGDAEAMVAAARQLAARHADVCHSCERAWRIERPH